MVDLYSGYPIGIKADVWALGVLLYHLCFFNLPFSTTLSIQTGEVAVPDNSPFSRQLHQIIHFCLNINPEARPNIWQLAEVTFKYANKPNPVPNKHNSPRIDLDNIEPLQSQSELAEQKAKQRKLQSERTNANNNLSTSIAPRQRPQAGSIVTQNITQNHAKKTHHTPTKPSEVISKGTATVLQFVHPKNLCWIAWYLRCILKLIMRCKYFNSKWPKSNFNMTIVIRACRLLPKSPRTKRS